MTMLVKENWNGDEEWYEVPTTLSADAIEHHDLDATVQYRRVAWWDKRSKNWIVQIMTPEGYQVGDAEFFANKRTFIY